VPTFETYSDSQVTKMLLIGDSGAGKTGSLVSLAAAGWNTRILDLDQGIEVIHDFVKNPRSIYLNELKGLWTKEMAKETIKRLTYVTLTEKVKIIKSQPMPEGKLWNEITEQLDDWKDGDKTLGNIGTWGPRDILVIDGLSRLSMAAFNFQLKMNGRLNQPQQSDYGLAQGYIRRLLMMLYSNEVKCNVIVICHVKMTETDMGPTKGFPQTIGSALGPEVGQYFNHALLAKTSGSGENIKRVIRTSTAGLVELKSAAPLRVKQEYDLATGLAEYFRDIRGGEVK
jgi:hypothetical protein